MPGHSEIRAGDTSTVGDLQQADLFKDHSFKARKQSQIGGRLSDGRSSNITVTIGSFLPMAEAP